MSVDAAAEWNRLAQNYREKSDDELEVIAAEAYDLTDTGREVLAAEIQARKLPLKLTLKPEPQSASLRNFTHVFNDRSDDDFQLATVYNAQNPEELLAVTRILDDVDTPYFIADENFERAEDYQGTFENGVAIKVAACEIQRVSEILEDSLPAEMWDSDEGPAPELLDPVCPACHSKEVIFVCKDPLEKGMFRWRCKDCKLLWIDDGVAKWTS